MTLSSLKPDFILFVFFCSFVSADVHRIGLFIGNNQGLMSETELKFAARDASEMASLFKQTGLYGDDGIILVNNKSMEQVREAFKSVEQSVQKWKANGSQTNLMLYFSGHGDAQSLHVRGKKFQREDLVAWLTALNCDLKIVILDACESGDFLRSKGGHFIQDLPVQIDEKLKSRGIIIVSSTSRGESAQESDEYKGAVFTHHFANGLRGLADYNADGWVGLQESFEYSRRATAMDMAMTGSLHQNPSFDLDVVGGSDPALVQVDRKKSWMLLKNFPTGTLDIYDANSLDRISRVWLSGSDSLAYRIQTGNYLFRFRDSGKEFILTENIGREGGVIVDRKKFQGKIRWTWANKGGPSIKLNAVETSFGFPHPFPRIPMQIGQINYVTRKAGSKTSLIFGIGSGQASDTTTHLANSLQLYQFGYQQTYFIAGSRRIRFYSGGLAAFNLIQQNLSDSRFNSALIPNGHGFQSANNIQWANVYQAGLPLEMEWAVYGRFWLSAKALYSFYGFRDSGEDRFRFRMELEPYFNLGVHF